MNARGRIEVVPDAAAIHRMWENIEARLAPEARGGAGRWRVVMIGAGVCAVAAAAVVLVLAAMRGEGPERAPAVASEEARDGGPARPHEHGVGVGVGPAAGREDDPRPRVDGRGAIERPPRDSVAPVAETAGGAHRWSVEVGAVRIEVVGTAFAVSRTARRVHVEALEMATPRSPRRRQPPEAHAPAALVTIDELLAEADRLRRAGDREGAIDVLARTADAADDRLAGVAWLTRARVLLQLGRTNEAAGDLRRAIAAGLPPALEAQARAQLEELE
jgi:transmembrane sensor